MKEDFGESNLRYLIEKPYGVLPEIYDDLMDHVDYGLWVDFLYEVLTDHGLPFAGGEPPPGLLECGCGTGTIVLGFAMLGYSVDAFDSSAAMIKRARLKTKSLENKPFFYVSDFLNFKNDKKYDAAICAYDSINYLRTGGLVVEFLERVKSALKETGIFVFDICTEANSKFFFNNRSETGEGEGYRYRREMRFYPKQRIQENLFYIYFDQKPDTVIIEKHRQRIYKTPEIR